MAFLTGLTGRFSKMAVAGFLACTIGAGVAVANDQASIPEPGETNLSENEEIISQLQAIAKRGQEIPSYYEDSVNIARDGNYIYAVGQQLENGTIRVNDSIFDAFMALAKHPRAYVRGEALHALLVFVEADEKYAQQVIRFFKDNPEIHYRSMLVVLDSSLKKYPDLRDDVFDILEKQLKSDEDAIIGDAVFVIEWYYERVKENTPQHERAFELLKDLLVNGKDNDWVKFRALGGLQTAVKEYNGLGEEKIKKLVVLLDEINLNDDDRIYLTVEIANKYPDMADELLALSKRVLGEENDADIRASGIYGVGQAGRIDPLLMGEVVAVLMQNTTDNYWKVRSTSIGNLSIVAKSYGEYREAIFNHLGSLEVDGATLGNFIIAYGFMGEKDIAYAATAFDMGKTILETGSYNDVKAGSFDIARAVEVVAAIGTEHESYRAEAFETLVGASEKDDLGGWYHDQIEPIIYRGMAEIGAVDAAYAKKAIDFATTAGDDNYDEIRLVAGMAIDTCNALDYANGVLVEQYQQAAGMTQEEQSYAGKAIDYIAQETENNPVVCMQKLEEKNSWQVDQNTKIQTGFMFRN